MEDLVKSFSSNFYQWLFGGFFSFLTLIISLGYKRFLAHLKVKENTRVMESEEQKDIKDGVKALLKFRVNKLSTDVIEKEWASLDEREDLEDMFNSYKKLGGNGRAEKKYIKSLDYETRFTNGK